MRLHIQLSENKELVPFNYQETQVSKLHYWVGKNDLHDDLSLYSLSWLQHGKKENTFGLNFQNGSKFFISCFDNSILKRLIKGIQLDNDFGWGMKVISLNIEKEPDIEHRHKFQAASPIFIKRPKKEARGSDFFYFDNPNSDQYLTETLSRKLTKAGLPNAGVLVKFDRDYPNPKLKGTTYKGIKSIGSICPIIIEGTPDQLKFAWNVGIGNSTGIGFGALI